MEVRKLRLQTGLSQSKFAKMFDVPVSTLKDWEQERRKTPAYVINMMRTILQYRGCLSAQVMWKHVTREESVWKITLEEMESRIDLYHTKFYGVSQLRCAFIFDIITFELSI